MKKFTTKPSLVQARLGLAVLAILAGNMALAAEDGWYGGISVGRSEADIDKAGIVAARLSEGFATTSLTDFEQDNGYKIFAGYQLNQNFAVEGGYFSLGEFGYMMELDPVATRRGDTRLMGLNLDLVGLLPLTESLQAFGKVGAIYGQSREQFSGHGPVTITTFSNRERELDYSYGAGLQYDLTPRFAMRLEAQRFRIPNNVLRNDNIDLYSIGVVYHLGTQAVATAPAPAPRTEAAAPRQEAAPAPAPAPVAPTRVSLSVDSLFDFDSSSMKAAGRAELDKLASDLRGVEYDNIMVTGHTDRIGDQEYNMGLSERRAQAVKDYLVQSANIAPGKITIRGVNGAGPVTMPSQCSGLAAPAQIACLAPDRRVEVEVSGTRPR